MYNTSWIDYDSSSNKMNIYLKSVYFACLTMTTVGYGDIVPTNNIEYIICILIMVFTTLYDKDIFVWNICLFIEYNYVNYFRIKKWIWLV